MDCTSVEDLLTGLHEGHSHLQLWQVRSITDEDVNNIMEELARHVGCSHIGFFRCGLSKSHIRTICEHLPRHIIHLLFQYCSVGDMGAPYVAQLLARPHCNLAYLYICDDEIGDRGVSIIAKSLRTNKSLKKLCVSDTLVTAASIRILKDAMDENVTLQGLEFPLTTIGPTDMIVLESLLRLIKNVDQRRHRQGLKALCYVSIDRLAVNSDWKDLPDDIIRRVKDILCG